MNNKSRANSICPLLDTGPPKGEHWVQVKKAIVPFHVVEMGTGAAGLANVKRAKAEQGLKDIRSQEQRRLAAEQAFCSGVGDLTTVLRQSDVITDPHYSALDARREADLHPPEPTSTKLKSLWNSFLKACKDTWDSAQEP